MREGKPMQIICFNANGDTMDVTKQQILPHSYSVALHKPKVSSL